MSFLLAALSAAFALHSGDVVVFYGDSITQQQLYTTYVESFVYGRYPTLRVRFYNRGWSGDCSWGGGGGSSQLRVDRDVKPLKPTVVTVMLGMNDGGYVPYDPKTFNTFNEWYGKLLGFLENDAPGARTTLIRTSPWDDFAHKHEPFSAASWHPWQGYNDALLQYGSVVEAWANKDHDTYVDFNAPVASMLRGAAEDNPEVAKDIIADSIHPGPAGHLIMAGALLKAWGASPVVADVVVDAKSKTVVESGNAKVSDFDGLTWTETDGSLPFCVNPEDKTIELALAHSSFTHDLNLESLRVQDLEPGTYTLSIDGQPVSKFTAAQLADGINLADYATPMRKQALDLLDLATKRSRIDFIKWRDVEFDEANLHSMPGAAKALDRLEDEIYVKERDAAQPKPHKFSLTRA